MTGAILLSTTLPTIIAMGIVAATVRRVFPMRGRGKGKSSGHWHFRRGNRAIKHAHPGGHLSHMHRGLPGYGRTKSTLRR